jgi:hypothetical protein
MFSLSFSFKKQHGEGDTHHAYSLAKWANVTHAAALLQERKKERGVSHEEEAGGDTF